MIYKTFLAVFNVVLIWLTPIGASMVFVTVLVLFDTLTGVYGARVTYKRTKLLKDKVTSNKAFQLVPKLIFYGLLLIIAHGLSLYVEQEIPFLKLAIAGISWIEIKSIDENFEKIFGYSFMAKMVEVFNKLKNIDKRKETEDGN